MTRSKDNMAYEVIKANQSKAPNILKDEIISLTGPQSKQDYPKVMRLITAQVEVDGEMKVMTFLSNNLEWGPTSICDLYKARWAIEVFFKQLKQTLQLADFLGYSKHAIRWQIWTALLTYLLLRFIAFKSKWRWSFSRCWPTRSKARIRLRHETGSSEAGALTVGVVTLPFKFEGQRREAFASEGARALAERVDAMVIVHNDRLLEMIDPRTAFSEAFTLADDMLHRGVQGITDLITTTGLVNVDFADVRAVMGNGGPSFMAIGQGKGKWAAIEAAHMALANPLFDAPLDGASSILFNVRGGKDLSLGQVHEVAATDPEPTVSGDGCRVGQQSGGYRPGHGQASPSARSSTPSRHISVGAPTPSRSMATASPIRTPSSSQRRAWVVDGCMPSPNTRQSW